MDQNIIDDNIWVEKYRPKKLDDVVLTEEYKNSFREFIKTRNPPNLMFIGMQGTGKTTIARILTHELTSSRDDVLELNGSIKTGVDTVRDYIVDFCMTPPFGNSSKKIVFYDEADYLSPNAQGSLRNVIEKYSSNVIFIFTANYKTKIIQPLFSRTKTFEFKVLPKEFVLEKVFDILKSENLEYEENFVKNVLNIFYPDFRRILNELSGLVSNNKIQSDYNNIVSVENTIKSLIVDFCDGIKIGDDNKMRQVMSQIDAMLKESTVDFISLYTDLDESSNIPPWAKITINKYANNHSLSLIPTLNFKACLYEIIVSGKKLKSILN